MSQVRVPTQATVWASPHNNLSLMLESCRLGRVLLADFKGRLKRLQILYMIKYSVLKFQFINTLELVIAETKMT